MSPSESIEKLIKKLRYQAKTETYQRILGNALQTLDTLEMQKPGAVAPNIRSIVMKNPITKLAAAAVIIIAVIIGINHFIGPVNVTGVALADVLQRIEQAKAFMYKMKMTSTVSVIPAMPAIEQQMEATVIISAEYGMKMIFQAGDPNGKKYTTETYLLPESKQVLMILPEMKRYMRMEFNDDLLAKTRNENKDPRYIIKQIMGSTYKELGRSEIDGVEVEGFEAADLPLFGGSGSKVTLWVDAKNWLPVRMEMDLKNEQMQAKVVIYGYQWDMAVQPEEFQPVIPEGFTSATDQPLQMPSADEQGAIEGLKFFAEILGSYPKTLDIMGLMKEFAAIAHSQNPTEAAKRLKEKMDTLEKDSTLEKDEGKAMAQAMEMMRPIQSLAMFYMMMQQNKKEPVYYGESVRPGEVGSVLLRWKISDDQYRVIFGDLTAVDVTAEQLSELEKPLLK
jgi:outer membrane lipoprotein-sorting protein